MTTLNKEIKTQFENPVHINGLTENNNNTGSPKLNIAPPIPPKTKDNVQCVCIEVTDEEDSTKPICKQDVVATLKQEVEELQEKLSLTKEELKNSNKANNRLQRRLDRYENTIKARRAQDALKKWNTPQPCLSDLHKTLTPEELSDAQQLIQQFVESERLYLNTLETIDLYFYQPLKMMAVYKRDIISTQQLEAIFLNSPQLVVLHRIFYAELIHLRYLPKDSLVEEFLIILERTVPSLALYCGFQAEYFMQNLQKELSQCNSKPQIKMLLEHLENKCDGKTLADLMRIPASRLSGYVSFLNPFLEERIKGTKGVNENVIKRIQAIIRYITSLQVEQMDNKSDWECILEKIKVLNRLSQDGPIPLEIFNPETKFVKQGPVIIKEKGKEVQKICFLFTTHIALADKLQNHHVMFTEDAMMSLVGATLYENVDMAGHIIQPDIHSGLEQDMLGFRINFFNQEHIVLRVGRPNEKKQWIDNIEKILESIKKNEASLDNDFIIPDVSPKIAAASLEKLFQHLTNPQIAYREDFIEVFLNTYPCFTTSRDVLTALFNCIRSPKEKTPDPTSSIQPAPNHVFTFNMDDTMDTVSHSTSMTSMSAASLSQNFSSGSDDDSDFLDSPETPRRNTKIDCQDTPTQEKPCPSIPSSFIKRTSLSTDSDSSPYTSGVPVADDNKKEAVNGWQDSTENGGHHQNTTVCRQQNDSTYVTFFRPLSRESGNLGDTEDEEVDYNSDSRPSLGFAVTNDELAHSLNSLDSTMRQLMESQSSHTLSQTFDDKTNYMRRMSEMNEGLDETQRMLYELQQPSLGTTPEDAEECFNEKEDMDNLRKYTGRPASRVRRNTDTNTSRLSVSSTLSLSEPDLVAMSVKTTPTQIQPVEDSLLTSLPPTVARKFTDASPSHNIQTNNSKRNRFSLGIAKSRKTSTVDKRNKSMPNQVHNARLSVNHPSAMYFGSPEPQPKPQSSPSRALGYIFKKKEKNKLNKSISSMDGFSDTPKRVAKLNRAPSLGPIKKSHYVNIDDLLASPSRNARDRSDEGSPRLKRKSSQSARNLSVKIFAVLNKWIETHSGDFTDDDEVMKLIDQFLQIQIDIDALDARLAVDTQDILHQQCSEAKSKGFPCFSNMLARVTTLDSTILEDIDWDRPAKQIISREFDLIKQSKESCFFKTLAEQISLMTFAYYNSILRSELLNCNWKKKDKEQYAPNICKMILNTNELTSWICTEVLSRDTVVARASVIDLFICVGWQCYKHNDMHNALSIAVALSSSCIKRLSKSWDVLDRRVRQKYEKLKDATDHHEKCKKLRERLENVTAASIEKTGDIMPALPYLGAYLELIYTLDIGVKTYNDDGLVNFAKMTKLSSLIDTVLQYQQQRFQFQPRLDIIAYITSAKRLSDNELYDLSVAREPSRRS